MGTKATTATTTTTTQRKKNNDSNGNGISNGNAAKIIAKGEKRKEADLSVLELPEYICPLVSVDLSAKQEPIHEHPFLKSKDFTKVQLLHDKIWCSKLGQIDVSGIKEKLLK